MSLKRGADRHDSHYTRKSESGNRKPEFLQNNWHTAGNSGKGALLLKNGTSERAKGAPQTIRGRNARGYMLEVKGSNRYHEHNIFDVNSISVSQTHTKQKHV